MRVLVINNLDSGLRDGAVYDFIRSFAQSGDVIDVRCVGAGANFQEAMQDAKTYDAVVASGGDGTVSTVCYTLRNTGIPILPFPAGTANLLVNNLESPEEPHALAKLLRNGKTLSFDVGEIEHDGEKHGFMMMAGCGYDATIMSEAAESKDKFGPVAYFRAAVSNPNPQISRFTFSVDGQRHELDALGAVLVNFSKIQFDISIATKNRPRDGKLDLLMLTAKSAWNLLPTVVGAAVDHSGKSIAQSNALKLFSGSEFTFDAQPNMNIQYDGEAPDIHTPFTARVLPGATRLFVSENGMKEFSD